MLRRAVWAGPVLLLILAATVAGDVHAQPYLSNLSATGSDPLFATYAAPLSRSEFVVDEGYRFVYYENDDGIDFETDTAGELSLAFKMNGEVRYLLGRMHAAPVVTASYSDLVRYRYEPFAGIEVDVFFQVYSSRLALLDVAVTNSTDTPADVEVYPFLQHAGGLTEPAITDDGRSFTFRHVERPDGWTTTHGVPYAADLQNVLLLSEPADAFGAYSDVGSPEPAEMAAAGSEQIGMAHIWAERARTEQTTGRMRATSALSARVENYAVQWGTVHHADGSLCTHTPPDARQVIWLDDRLDEILTETAPKWGDPDPNIPGNGFQGAELGNFANPPITVGDTFTVLFSCLSTGQVGQATGTIIELPAPGGIQTNIQLQDVGSPGPPENLEVVFSQEGVSAAVSWDAAPGLTYSVYRRDGEPAGRYDRIATRLDASGMLDANLDPDVEYGYVVVAHDSDGNPGTHSREVGRSSTAPLFNDFQNEHLGGFLPPSTVKAVAFQRSLQLAVGETRRLRIVRGVTELGSSIDGLLASAESLLTYDVEQALRDDEALYVRIPPAPTADGDLRMVYWSAFNLLRQVMLPPEGSSSYNYYVFSREPTWGWGHGGQVFHESLAMLAYVYMDPESALNSQRVYFERQHADGYINYRTGAYLDETIPTGDDLTTSAPWLSWENWELYRVIQDRSFLAEAYDAGTAFYEWWLANRDEDRDGLAEWGGHAVLESVRDGQVALWTDVGWPSNFEALDLNVMLVREARALAEMAEELGDSEGAARWTAEAGVRTEAVQETFWDEETGFFYHVDRDDHDFTFSETNDLKRQEIIGFLPLWAGAATEDQAARLIEHLTDEEKFWRPYGIPTLAADDPFYNPMGYWNGPVWVQWQYLIFRGLLDYDYDDLAEELARKVLESVTHHLSESHTFWELYSPDDLRAGFHQTYIWTGIVARMMLDLNGQTPIATVPIDPSPAATRLNSYPNPFSSSTTIEYRLPEAGDVRIAAYDAFGRRVATLFNGPRPAGRHTATWDVDSAPLASGVYFIRLETGGLQMTRAMLLMR